MVRFLDKRISELRFHLFTNPAFGASGDCILILLLFLEDASLLPNATLAMSLPQTSVTNTGAADRDRQRLAPRAETHRDGQTKLEKDSDGQGQAEADRFRRRHTKKDRDRQRQTTR